MHALKAEEPFTGVLITHDLRESIFLADQVVVLSGRPVRTQFTLDVTLGNPRRIDQLYTPQAAEMLNTLRKQIEIAQGRAPDEAAA
jgi:NitT/TauT family transport system ATP-binding protein